VIPRGTIRDFIEKWTRAIRREGQGKREKGQVREKVEHSEIPNVILCEVNRRVSELTKSISGGKVREKVEPHRGEIFVEKQSKAKIKLEDYG